MIEVLTSIDFVSLSISSLSSLVRSFFCLRTARAFLSASICFLASSTCLSLFAFSWANRSLSRDNSASARAFSCFALSVWLNQSRSVPFSSTALDKMLRLYSYASRGLRYPRRELSLYIWSSCWSVMLFRDLRSASACSMILPLSLPPTFSKRSFCSSNVRSAQDMLSLFKARSISGCCKRKSFTFVCARIYAWSTTRFCFDRSVSRSSSAIYSFCESEKLSP